MSQKDEEFEQQILFEESNESDTEEGNLAQQIILPDEAWQPVEESIEQQPIVAEGKSRPKWLWRIAGSAFSFLCVYELVQFFIEGFQSSPFITGIYAVLIGSVCIMGGLALVNELRGLMQFKKQQKTQRRAQQLYDQEKVFDGQAFCQNITKQLPSDVITKQQQMWLEQINDQFTEAEVVDLYEITVLSKVDEQALKQIARFSTESVMLVAISPVAIVDMMVLMWRNLRMIDKIAGLYGIHLGYWSRIKLLKQVFTNMIFAGASEIVADVGLDMLGVESLGRVSTRAAQGLGAGMLTARLGINAMHLARPLPFNQEAPKLSRVRKAVIDEVKKLLLSKTSKTVINKVIPKQKERVEK